MIFCDLNESLCNKVKSETKLMVINGDVFEVADRHNGLIATASNPEFRMGAGLDLAIRLKYPTESRNLYYGKIDKHIIGIVSVGYNFRATPMLIQMALSTLKRMDEQIDRQIIFTGLGTKLGGMDEDEFISILKSVVN